MEVGRLLSYWEGNFSGAMLNFGRVIVGLGWFGLVWDSRGIDVRVLGVQEISNGRTHVSRTPKPENLIARSQLRGPLGRSHSIFDGYTQKKNSTDSIHIPGALP